MSTKSASVAGSSPRVRGKRKVFEVARWVFRLIPARAGKTSNAAPNAHPTTAHPRACGENLEASPGIVLLQGSSPRVRGKLGGGARGPPWGGSSPRVRGKPAGTAAHPDVDGLIPARAGKTSGAAPRNHRGTAHPRACGENWTIELNCARQIGSSPRVRGKHCQLTFGARVPRLIPARAGKTARSPRSWIPSPAHPRACGENRWCSLWVPPMRGSSPRVRGKRPRERVGPRHTGLIPARAGKTQC